MTARQPRRTRRRRAAPAAALPRPVIATGEDGELMSASQARRSRHVLTPREHHVTTDYRYVRKDLILVAAVAAVAVAFVVGMSFVVP